MANFFTKLFSKKSNSVVGIDIGSSSIKVVQLAKRGGQAILETYGEIALGPYGGVEVGRATNLSPEKIAEAVNDVLRESKITTRNCGISIPFGSSLITPIEMPAVSDRELAQMIPLEARKYIPVQISEVSLDWWVIPKINDKAVNFATEEEKLAKGDKLDILLVAIHNDTIARYQTIVNTASLEASFFEIEIFSAVRALSDQEINTQMVIDLGAATTKVYIVERGIVRSSHIINRGGQDISIALSKALGVSVQQAEIMKRDMRQIPADKMADVNSIIELTSDFIFSEAHRVMLAYQRHANKDVPKAVVVGGGAMLQGVIEYAGKQLQTEVAPGDPFSKAEAPAFLQDMLKTTGPEFSVAMGLALRKLSELN